MFKILLWALFISVSSGAKIMGIFMTPSYSHQVMFQPIWRELSLQGHQVTVITPNPLNDPTLTNLTEIDIGPFSYGVWKESAEPDFGLQKGSTIAELRKIQAIYNSLADKLLDLPLFKKLIENGDKDNFDLFLVEYLHPAMIAFKDLFKCPMIGISSVPLHSSLYTALGMTVNPIVNPSYILPFSKDLNFQQRVVSTLVSHLMNLGKYMQSGKNINAIIKKHFGPNTREYYDIMSDVSLVIANGNMATQNLKPTLPQYIEVSGIHLKPRKPLPKDLKTILDESHQGVIYFSLGTNVKSSLLPAETLEQFMHAFKGLPYKVLWKFETDEVPKVPDNVIIRKWMPQQDVLAHPNIKMFITQGGLQSLDEAIFNKVPMLVIPFIADQMFNADMIQKNGGGLKMDFNDFTSQEMREKILTLIEDKQYKQSITKLSTIAFDQPQSALETAVWHINYVLRHDGAPHLIYKAKTLPFYQYYMLDVYAFFLVTVILVLLLLTTVVVKVLGVLRRILGGTEKQKGD